MNERLKRLASDAGFQSGIWAPSNNHSVDCETELNKFAELIIQECVETLKKDMELAHIQMIPLTFKMYANGQLQRTVKAHFGIKE
tara:strand:- start:99 stop:353 length:255 start_codon:yes stop_codon:yes gene_type:complete